MKNNLLPSLVMLLAGLVCSIISLRQGVDLLSFTTRLLTVLVVFYIIGAILKVILSCAFKAMEDRQKKAEAAEAKTDDSEVFDNDGATLVGFTSIDGYSFERSRALKGDKWCGLVIDIENQSEMTDKRIKDWCRQVKKEFEV